AEGLPAVTVPNSNRPASVPPMVFIRLPPRRAPRGCRAMQHLSESRWPDGALVSSARPDSTTWQSIQAGPGPRACAVHCNWREHWKGRHHRGWCPCGVAGSERVLGRQAHQRGGALGTLDLRAAVDVDQRAGLGAMVVIVQADAEVLGGVPARADAGIPAAAVRIAAAAHAQILADGVVVVGGAVRCPEVAAAHADVPGGVDVDTRVRARGPAAQRIARFGLVHVVVVEHVADAEVAEVDVAQLGAHAPAVADLPAIAAGHAIAGFAAAVALEEVEVAGTEAPGSTAIGTPDVAGDEPCAFAGRQAGTVGVAGSALCKCKGGEHRRNQRGRNHRLSHWGLPYLRHAGRCRARLRDA